MGLVRHGQPDCTLILPVYNAEGFLADNLRVVREWLASREETWELLVVDDASSDGTPRVAAAFAAAHPLEAIEHHRLLENRGKGFAVRVGFGLARGRFVFFTDCDLAYPIGNIARVLEALEAGADAAIACRVLPASTYLISPSFFSYLYTRHIMGRAFNLICRLLTVPRILDTQAGLKGFRTEAVRGLASRLQMDGFSFDVELLRALLDRGARIAEVPVSFRYDSEPSTVRFAVDSSRMFRDLVRIRLRSLRGRYRAPAAAAPGQRGGVIVHADDFGLAPGVNRAIEEGLLAGVISSTSIMVNAPLGADALRWAVEHPEFDYGVHLNLTHGRPVLPPEEVPSLVGRSGEFRPLAPFLVRFATGRIRFGEVAAEWRAQLARARDAGVAVSRVDSHQHVHLLPRLFSRVVRPLARDEGLTVRLMHGPACGPRWLPDPKGVVLSLLSRAHLRGDARLLACARGAGTALTRRPELRVMRSMVDRMEAGQVYELVVHPGLVDAELRASGDGYVDGRESERLLLASAEFRALLSDSGLERLDLRRAAARVRARSA